MRYKCNYCDPVTKRGSTPVKSINTEADDYLRDKNGKYYHDQCYRMYLMENKKMSEESIELLVNELKKEQQKDLDENHEKDKFLRWIMDFYDSSLSSYFLRKLHDVRRGNYRGLNEPIDYATLLDIYGHMKVYLNKNASKKQFDNMGQRMNYDLAVVVGNYGDYKKYKEKKREQEIIKCDLEEELTRSSIYKRNVEQKTNNDKGDFTISDIIDDLLL